MILQPANRNTFDSVTYLTVDGLLVPCASCSLNTDFVEIHLLRPNKLQENVVGEMNISATRLKNTKRDKNSNGESDIEANANNEINQTF